LLESPPGAAEVGAREWDAAGSMLTDDRATQRQRIAIRAVSIGLWLWFAIAFFEAVYSR